MTSVAVIEEKDDIELLNLIIEDASSVDLMQLPSF